MNNPPCPKCRGLLVWHALSDPLSVAITYPALRCINCGWIIEKAMVYNRAHPEQPRWIDIVPNAGRKDYVAG